jgi:ParB-like chromosome segregation protein Spo0J
MKSPVYNVQAVPVERVRANSYNPNSVAPPEMRLLELSVWEDGYTQPVVCYPVPGENVFEVVDGFHRYSLMNPKSKLFSKRIHEREGGMLPVVVIDKPMEQRMASTIRHNRARGTHSIELMVDMVAELKSIGQSDAWILKKLGMDADELLRLKQLSGLAELFKDREFTEAEAE